MDAMTGARMQEVLDSSLNAYKASAESIQAELEKALEALTCEKVKFMTSQRAQKLCRFYAFAFELYQSTCA